MADDVVGNSKKTWLIVIILDYTTHFYWAVDMIL